MKMRNMLMALAIMLAWTQAWAGDAVTIISGQTVSTHHAFSQATP